MFDVGRSTFNVKDALAFLSGEFLHLTWSAVVADLPIAWTLQASARTCELYDSA